MRAVILSVPEIVNEGGAQAGIKFEVGDRKGKKAVCTVKVDVNVAPELEMSNEVKKGDEVILCCGHSAEIGK
jgi:hypothetical protein